MMGGEGFATGDAQLRIPLIHESSDVPQNQEESVSILDLPGATYAEPHTSSQVSSLHIAEPESPPTVCAHPIRLQTPRQSPRHRRTPANSPRRRIRVGASPPSQRQNQFARTTERFARLEEHRIDVEVSNASLLRAVLKRTAQREQTILEALTSVGNRMTEQHSQHNAVMADALKTLGEGLKALKDMSAAWQGTS